MRKYASLEVLESWQVPARVTGAGLRKAAHRVAFDYDPRPGYLYVRSRMISSRTNDNHDTFPAGEIEKGYRTFLGKPVFVNHHNANHRRARGVIVAVALHRDRNPDGSPDTWVEGLMEVDALRFPRLAKAIITGRVNRTSMGVDVEWSTCSACGNKATSPAEYCKHLPAMKGKKIRRRNQATGKVEERLIHEVCAGLSFFENSLLVEEPADPTAYVVGSVDTRGMSRSASRRTASGPDFRDRIPNSCTTCGEPVRYRQRQGDFTHDTMGRAHDHPASPSRPDDHTGSRNYTYGGTHCLACGEPVRINLRALRTDTGGWHHHDGMKRDHPAIPADEQAVYDSIPGVNAAFDQARMQVRDHMQRQFEQLGGEPVTMRRGDEDKMPPDPFLASRGCMAASFRKDFTHCSNCGVPLLDPDDISNSGSPGDWVHHGYPHLCMHCAAGPVAGSMPGTPGKPQPVFPGNRGGYHLRPELMGDAMFTDDLPEGYRPWERGDAVRQSTSAKAAQGGDHPFFKAHPVSSANIVAAYHDSTDDERSLGDRWYSDAHHVAKSIAGGDAALGAGVLSAYSPRTAWPVNMFNASRALQGDPPGPGSGAMGMHQKAAMRIIAGEHHSKVLKAPKTAAFAHLIEHGGDTPEDEKNGTHKVVIDRHAMSVAMGHRISDKDDAPLGQPQHYEHVAKAYREAAHILSDATGRKISPHQVQAATWLRQIRKNHEEDSAGHGGGGLGAGRGRVKMQDNSKSRWEHHHKERHPGGIGEENMHYHGASGKRCFGCQRLLSVRGNPMSTEHPHVPGLCMGCASRTVQAPDFEPNPDLMGEGRRAFGPSDHFQPSLSSRLLPVPASLAGRVAYGETRVPSQVDTLRMEECPVCGEHDVWSGDRCPVCGFIVPPSLFRDPDVTKAQQVRDELDQEGEVVTQGEPGDPSTDPVGSGEDADDQLGHPDQMAPDGTPGVQGEGGPVPGVDTDGEPGEPPEPGEDDGELPPGAQDEEMQGEEEEEQGAEEEAEGEALQEGAEEEGQALQPDLMCPACGAAFSTDMAAQPGTPCPACRMGSLEPIGGPQKGQEDPGEAEPDDEDEEEDMPQESKTAAALARAQAYRIAVLTAENEVLAAQLGFLASAAGIEPQLAQIRRAVMHKHADLLNPASPVPDPPEAPATESTEQALQPMANDDPSRPGTTPGANAGVPAQQTTTAITPGVEMQSPPATNLIDVTAPVTGTNPSQDGGVPISQRRIETDVRVDPDPLKAHGPGIGGQGNNGAAFPWMLDAQPGQQKQGMRTQASGGAPDEAASATRTFASIRLAKLRIATGSAHGDELSVAAAIEQDQRMPITLIEHEIGVLSRMPAPVAQAPRPMQRAAARSAPSLASVGAAAYYAPAAADYDMDASDLFD